MRACLQGHEETALFLYRWNAAALKVRNYDGETCLDLAAKHEKLAAELERLEKIRKLSHNRWSSSSSSSAKLVGAGAASGNSGRNSVGKGEFLKPGLIAR